MIRNILFDMGNVLIPFTPDVFISRVHVSPEDADLLNRVVYRSVEWVELDRGLLDDDSALDRMRLRLPERLWDAADTLVRRWNEPPQEVEGMTALAGDLAAAGYELYLLTNAGPRHRTYWFTFPPAAWFPEERIFRSADWKVLKPEREFYETALDKFALNRRECLFIDDSPTNVEGARRCGIDGLVFHGSAQLLCRELREKGIL